MDAVERRFWRKVDRSAGGAGCWVWTACLNSYGYGQFAATGRQVQAHRFSYELLIGAIPHGLDIDHLCRNRACVNPAHLEPVTRRVNLLRGETIVAECAAKTECPVGHVYDDANTRIDRRGARRCRACHREREMRRYYANKEAV